MNRNTKAPNNAPITSGTACHPTCPYLKRDTEYNFLCTHNRDGSSKRPFRVLENKLAPNWPLRSITCMNSNRADRVKNAC
jgi:hypothetical protein